MTASAKPFEMHENEPATQNGHGQHIDAAPQITPAEMNPNEFEDKKENEDFACRMLG